MRVSEYYIYPIDTDGDINKALDAGNKLQSQLQQIFDDVSIITEYDYSGNIIANYIKNIQKINESDLIVVKSQNHYPGTLIYLKIYWK